MTHAQISWCTRHCVFNAPHIRKRVLSLTLVALVVSTNTSAADPTFYTINNSLLSLLLTIPWVCPSRRRRNSAWGMLRGQRPRAALDKVKTRIAEKDDTGILLQELLWWPLCCCRLHRHPSSLLHIQATPMMESGSCAARTRSP